MDTYLALLRFCSNCKETDPLKEPSNGIHPSFSFLTYFSSFNHLGFSLKWLGGFLSIGANSSIIGEYLESPPQKTHCMILIALSKKRFDIRKRSSLLAILSYPTLVFLYVGASFIDSISINPTYSSFLKKYFDRQSTKVEDPHISQASKEKLRSPPKIVKPWLSHP